MLVKLYYLCIVVGLSNKSSVNNEVNIDDLIEGHAFSKFQATMCMQSENYEWA